MDQIFHLQMTPQQVCQVYKYRFGIETSKRCANQVRGWTTSPNPALRFLLMALAVYWLNVWVWLRWCFTQTTESLAVGFLFSLALKML